MLVFAMIIVFLTFLGLGIKFSRWGKNSLGGVKIHQVGTSETVRYVRSSQLLTSTIQSLCISILETLLHVTLKRRAEISADIFARLLRYFFLSCKNLTISGDTCQSLTHTKFPQNVKNVVYKYHRFRNLSPVTF